MKKTIYTLAILSSIFVSCNGDLKDDIDDLQESIAAAQAENDALNELIEASGIDNVQSIDINHEYSYDANNTIVEEFTWSGLTYPYYQLDDNGDDTYDIYIYIEDYQSDANYTGYIEIEIDEYDPVTGDFYLDEMNYQLDDNIYGDYVYMYFSENTSYATTTITIDSFNAETGEISIESTSEYTENYAYSEYDTDGVFTLKFEGVLPVKQTEPTTATIVSKTIE